MENYDNLISKIQNNNDVDVNSLNSLSLAFLGDSIHTFFIKNKLIESNDSLNHKLHKLTKKYVSAKAQSLVLSKLKKEFTEEELAIVKRARNNKNKTIAKNASIRDYNNATALEAIIGYLYLKGENERLVCILKKTWSIIENDDS